MFKVKIGYGLKELGLPLMAEENPTSSAVQAGDTVLDSQEAAPAVYQPQALLTDPFLGVAPGKNYTAHFYSIAANTSNEDRILFKPELGLFGIFDGHGGYRFLSLLFFTSGFVACIVAPTLL